MEMIFQICPWYFSKWQVCPYRKFWFDSCVRLSDSASVGGKQPISAKSVLFEKVRFFLCFLSFDNGSNEAEDDSGIDCIVDDGVCFECKWLDRWNSWKSCLWCLWWFFSWSWRSCSWRYLSLSLIRIFVNFMSFWLSLWNGIFVNFIWFW